MNIAFDKETDSLIIDGSSYKGNAEKKTIVGTWWNHEIIEAKAQISAISGRIIEQKVTFIGKEEIKIGDKTFNTLQDEFGGGFGETTSVLIEADTVATPEIHNALIDSLSNLSDVENVLVFAGNAAAESVVGS